MNLYLVSRDKCDYDEYSDFVVAANSEDEALSFLDAEYKAGDKWSNWPNEGTKSAEFIGTTDKYAEPTEILGSFHAG